MRQTAVRTIILILFTCLFVAGCKKNKSSAENAPEELPVVTVPDTGLKCQALPPTPEPFGWKDTMNDENRNINAFLFNPVNPNEIICVVNGDAFGKNKMLNYSIVTKQANYLATLGNYLPQVNQNGWIVYSDLTNCVFKIKSDGTGYKQLTYDHRSHDPKWDHTGNYIFYYTEAHMTVNVKAQLHKIDTSGYELDVFEQDLPYSAPFKKSNKMICIKIKDNTSVLILKELDPPISEKELISGPVYSKPGQIYFDNMTLDNNDENLYWSNSNGIYRYNLASQHVDSLFKNCPNMIFDNPIISYKAGELTYSQHVMIPLSTISLLHKFRAMEFNIYNGQSTEIRIFP
jgi:hypothetical protein